MGDRERVIIVGGGYAGANTARHLGDDVAVTIVSEDNFLLSTPMLAEVAAGYLDPRHIVTPIRQMAPRARSVQGTVVSIDAEHVSVVVRPPMGMADITLEADRLVIALGAVPADFGVPGVRENSLDFKTIEHALRIRNRILALLEASIIEPNESFTSIAVVGAGYSGAELAAALSDFAHDAARRFYPDAPPVRVTLIDAVDRVTPALTERLSAAAARQLEERAVRLALGKKVAEVDERGVVLEDGTRVKASTVIWAAGVKPNPLIAETGLPVERGRLIVDGTMRASERVFGLGDAAAVPLGQGEISPPTAQFAVRQAKYLGDNLADIIAGGTVDPFEYSAQGELVSLGHHNAVGRIFNVPVSGLPAWFLWRSYYLLQVPSLFRRFRIAMDWTLDLVFPPDVARIPSSDLGPDLR